MKVASSLAILSVAALGLVQASPSPEPTAAPVVKRQLPANLPLPDLASLTDAAALSSLSSYIDAQFSALYSLEPSASSLIAAAESSAKSYLSVANGLATITNSAEASKSASAIYSSVMSDLNGGGGAGGASNSMAASGSASKPTASATQTAASSGSGGSNAASGGWEAVPLLVSLSTALVGAVAVLAF
ncbi:uncharacterized protein PFL1_00484 [Pseudozyma flocculosa PF-1]|uniref:Uncharacterized protein n=1 Tax=Pseudozyma flocculosa TaxID=84751 RepID=A0A5C3ETB7_9BASI|nr:uncharacterized protein PFL1_00484 [Pseudozyma flocculosa PF-1]EPQ32287.1 hypothetical protein PFL1_00484 [Pseudozyma flocculosa PF-1]SPO34757.1 uncharacterized protein PSFLO_00228 [Pseudozyma flocculosa]